MFTPPATIEVRRGMKVVDKLRITAAKVQKGGYYADIRSVDYIRRALRRIAG
jgi:hypothetical protein